MQEIEQRSKEWYGARAGKITSSKMDTIMSGTKIASTKGCSEYLYELAMQRVLGPNLEPGYVNSDMQRGIDLEPMAKAWFEREYAHEFLTIEDVGFVQLSKSTGSSPDGLVGKRSLIEIKCPLINTFSKVLAGNYVDSKYMYQMQHQMLCTGREKCYYLNYIIYNGKEYGYVIEVERDEAIIAEIIKRIDEAEVLISKYEEQIKKKLKLS